jgi:hypothetical protein
MSEFIFWAFVAIVFLGGVARGFSKTSSSTVMPISDDTAAQDFALFRDSVSDQESRLDALDSSLGALAALLFAILSYLPSHRTGDAGSHLALQPTLAIVANILLVGPILAALFAAIAFRGSEGPDLERLLVGIRKDREKTFLENTKNLARDHFRNSELIRRKLRILRISVIVGATGTLVLSVAPVVKLQP